jgi:hypothetical protein
MEARRQSYTEFVISKKLCTLLDLSLKTLIHYYQCCHIDRFWQTQVETLVINIYSVGPLSILQGVGHRKNIMFWGINTFSIWVIRSGLILSYQYPFSMDSCRNCWTYNLFWRTAINPTGILSSRKYNVLGQKHILDLSNKTLIYNYPCCHIDCF